MKSNGTVTVCDTGSTSIMGMLKLTEGGGSKLIMAAWRKYAAAAISAMARRNQLDAETL
jgi:hypothetical protein